jgi:hypothetical protein
MPNLLLTLSVETQTFSVACRREDLYGHPWLRFLGTGMYRMHCFCFALLIGCDALLPEPKSLPDESVESVAKEGASPGDCTDGADNDADGLFDCNDPDCSGSPDCTENFSAGDCTDGADNDADGLYDCADPDCDDVEECGGSDDAEEDSGDMDDDDPPLDFEGDEPGECEDELDNDGDGDTDCADSDCEGAPVCQTESECSDGLDNDGDSLQDCHDPDCAEEADCLVDDDGDGFYSHNDCDDGDASIFPWAEEIEGDGIDQDCDGADLVGETLVELACGDGIDNDGDGVEDCSDSDCDLETSCIESDCANGMDDDANGLVDCDDPDCGWDSACLFDEDGDGYYSIEDCDDEDASVNPAAEDIEGDGIDQDCSGSDWVFVADPSAEQAYEAMDVDPADVLEAGLEGEVSTQVALSEYGVIQSVSGGDMLLLYTGTYGVDPQPGIDLGTYGPTNDMSSVSLELQVPAGMTAAHLSLYFLTAEYPEFVGTTYGDRVEVNVAGVAYSGNAVGDFLSTNGATFLADESGFAGTGYDNAMGGGTGWMDLVFPVTPEGVVSVEISIEDISDGIYDSSVLIDGFSWSPTECMVPEISSAE